MVGTPTERDYLIIDVLLDVTREFDASPAAVALAWVHSRPGVPSTLIGARRIEQFEANLKAFDVELPTAHVERLERTSAPALYFPTENNKNLAPGMVFAGATVDGFREGWPVRVIGETLVHRTGKLANDIRESEVWALSRLVI